MKRKLYKKEFKIFGGTVPAMATYRSPNWVRITLPWPSRELVFVRDGTDWILTNGRMTIARKRLIAACGDLAVRSANLALRASRPAADRRGIAVAI